VVLQGQSAASVTAALVAAIEIHPILSAQGIRAAVAGGALLTNGDITSSSFPDPGFQFVSETACFAFSYEFADGAVVEGTFNGEIVGDLVQDISDLEASYEGTDLGALELPPNGCCKTSFSGWTMDLEGNGFDGSMLPVGIALQTEAVDIAVVGGLILQPPILPGDGLIFDRTRWSLSVKPTPVPALGPAGMALLILAIVAAASAEHRRRAHGPRR
jgi:hypothetical protein